MQVRCKHALRSELGRGSSCRTNSHPSRKKRKEAATRNTSTTSKEQHSTALLLASAPRAGNAEREERDRSPDITPDELAPAGRHLICAT